MNRLIRWPTPLGGMVLTAVLMSLTLTSSHHAEAQISVQFGSSGYYNPYGQGPYGGSYNFYGQGPYGYSRYDRDFGRGYGLPTSTGRVAMYRGGVNAYPYGAMTQYRSAYGYRSAPYVRQYDRTLYYQPSRGPVYVPFGYRPY